MQPSLFRTSVFPAPPLPPPPPDPPPLWPPPGAPLVPPPAELPPPACPAALPPLPACDTDPAEPPDVAPAVAGWPPLPPVAGLGGASEQALSDSAAQAQTAIVDEESLFMPVPRGEGLCNEDQAASLATRFLVTKTTAFTRSCEGVHMRYPSRSSTTVGRLPPGSVFSDLLATTGHAAEVAIGAIVTSGTRD